MSSRDAHDVHKALMMATDSPKDAIVFNLSKGLLIDFTLSGAVQHWMRGHAVLWQSRLRQALLTNLMFFHKLHLPPHSLPLLQLALFHRISL